ncbi:MAG: BMP family ABC transporter substrate-binding protein [Lachnospiraceae bacterium]|nr:BMP family ABC transporter substrate-binding protein [Lachnospiraceae bacterium]
MKNEKQWKISLFGAGVLILLLIVVIIMTADFEKEDKVTVGFIMTGKTQEEGWNRLHYEGILAACRQLEVELLVKEEVKENTGQCEQAIRELAKEEADMIILSSYGYAEEVLEVVKEYPEIAFYSESFDHEAENMKSYFARMYQARYLAGIVAGKQSETNVIGYVAAMANNEVNRGINAFTLGVKRENPEAKVVVAWSNSWDDAQKEKELAQLLIEEENVDVIAYHQNQPNVVEVAEQYKIASIGYHEPVADASENFLTAAVFHWDLTYKEVLLDHIRDKSTEVDTYWVGIEQDAIGLSAYSPKVSEEAIEEVEQAKQEMIAGFDVFSGEIYDRDGVKRCSEGETISDEQLLKNFDWYVEGVELYEEK